MRKKSEKDLMVEILEAFKIGVKNVEVHKGPSTTLYEITPKIGVKISKIRNLKDEIAIGLKADSVRIIAPIPGKGTVGIEVPNKERKILNIESILSSKEYKNTNMALPCAIGETITGDILMADLADMPHLLIAGATGQGKSVGLNTILVSLMQKRTPDELRFVLIDPKQVEFGIYKPLEKSYLARPVVTDATEAVVALSLVQSEMESRYKLLSEASVRNIEEYNTTHKEEKMKYLVVVVDEYGDLIMQAGKTMEKLICMIAQKARAVGIHIILSTQRPSVRIVTGDIKANFPVRIAFRTSTSTDSRVILGKKGAEALTGCGDMLFFSNVGMVRAQCAYTPTEYVRDFVNRTVEKYKDYKYELMFAYDKEIEEEKAYKSRPGYEDYTEFVLFDDSIDPNNPKYFYPDGKRRKVVQMPNGLFRVV